MNKHYPNLFTPITIRGVTFKNRIFNAPTTHHALQADEPFPNEEMIMHMVNKARGGAASVCFGGVHIFKQPYPDDSHLRYNVESFDNKFYRRAFIKMTDGIHFYGAKACCELLWFGHKEYTPEDAAVMTVYGCNELCREDGVHVVQTPRAEIERIAGGYGHAAKMAKAAGFDTVLLHFGHGTEGHYYMSPKLNRRTDEFGGSFENRTKYHRMILDAIHEQAPDILVEMRLSGAEHSGPGGLEIEEVVRFIKSVEDRVDYVHISAGDDSEHSRAIMHPTGFLPTAPNAYLAVEAKKLGVKIPVLAIGSIYDPEVAEKLIAEGGVDGVATARGLIADPEYPNKAFEGRRDDIVPCIKCLNCLDGWTDSQHHACAVNPAFGRESFLPKLIRPVTSSRKVAVIGGGPAGMKAALTAAERGHRVTLFEKTDRLGGQLQFADAASFKYDLKKYKDYLIRQVIKAPIELRLGCEAAPKEITELEFDAVLVAVGAEPVIPPIPGVEKAVTAARVYSAPQLVGRRVVVVGGGQVGCETAIHLAQNGHEVSIIEMRSELAPDALHTARIPLLENIKRLCTPYTGVACAEILEGGVKLQGGHIIEADTVVLAAGMKPLKTVAERFADCAGQVVYIGDCVETKNVNLATHTAFDAAMNIV